MAEGRHQCASCRSAVSIATVCSSTATWDRRAEMSENVTFTGVGPELTPFGVSTICCSRSCGDAGRGGFSSTPRSLGGETGGRVEEGAFTSVDAGLHSMKIESGVPPRTRRVERTGRRTSDNATIEVGVDEGEAIMEVLVMVVEWGAALTSKHPPDDRE